MMRLLPATQAAAPAHSGSRARLLRRMRLRATRATRASLGTLVLAAACGERVPNVARDSAIAPAPSAAAASRTAMPDDTLIGRLLSDVVPDSALLSSWGMYPLERHIGIRLALIGGEHYLLADTLDGYDGDRPRWRIRQAQRVEAARPGEGWVGSCAIGTADASDGTVVARVTLSAGEALTPIHSAWRLDPATWHFRSFPTDSLACYNEGGGNP